MRQLIFLRLKMCSYILRSAITVIQFPASGVWSILSHCWTFWLIGSISRSKLQTPGLAWPVKLYVQAYVFTVLAFFFQNPKNVTFYVLSCCAHFLEHCLRRLALIPLPPKHIVPLLLSLRGSEGRPWTKPRQSFRPSIHNIRLNAWRCYISNYSISIASTSVNAMLVSGTIINYKTERKTVS